MNIERIRNADAQLVKELFRRADLELENVNPDFFLIENNILLVAYINGNPAGFLYGYLLERIDSNKPMIFLYSIDVFSAYQKRGVGTSLIEELKQIAIKNNCSEVFVLTNDNNLPAKKMYEKTGGIRENSDDVMFVYKI